MKEQYIHSVRILMDCPPAEKERLISRLNSALTTYLEDVPNAAEEDLTANFGSPEDCAARLLEECTPKEVIAERQKRAHHQRILVAVLAVLLTVALSVALYLWSNGGLVIINTSDTAPDYMDNLPSDHIVYNYDN